MIKVVFVVICSLLTTVGSFSQTPKTPIKPLPNQLAKSSEISEKDWNEMIKNLEAEDWSKASLFISQSIAKLKIENNKKQLARLRYFYLYSLAGKVSQAKMTFAELEKISDNFSGQDFLMPPRSILADCNKALNYICAVKNYSKTLRFTASNKAFDAIHSFEYVQLLERFELEKHDRKFVVLGGKLKKVEFNPKKETSWIMRLYFEKGTVEMMKN